VNNKKIGSGTGRPAEKTTERIGEENSQKEKSIWVQTATKAERKKMSANGRNAGKPEGTGEKGGKRDLRDNQDKKRVRDWSQKTINEGSALTQGGERRGMGEADD